jgi:predicted RNA binding protein YcfA (HicA-like mRNA interferase family)
VNKEIKKLMREYQRNGWLITPARGSHLKWRAPNGALVVTSSSNSFALRQIVCDLRRVERLAS